MSDDSEYEEYNDFAGLTEEDFARLDHAASESSLLNPPSLGIAALSQTPDRVEGTAMPSIFIEIEGSVANAEQGSPIQRYRRGGTLSVTDLISLAWCEVQFDYGMRQKRFRRLADRPPSFRAESGKEIVVQQDVAARNDKTTKRGQFIHKELELELRPEEIQVVIATEEERWAFRILNFLSSIVCLEAEGCVREVPVFGTVDGVVVVGIIDELLVRDQSEPEIGTKRPSDSSLPPQKRACRSPSPPSCEPAQFADSLAPIAPSQCIRLIDTKTRRTYSLPSDEDAEPAHLQVMLYHRLLTRLLDNTFDFSALWAVLGMCPSAPFSQAFLQQAAPILSGSDSVPVCLDGMVLLLRTRLAELDLPRVDHVLQIIYRSQNKYSDRGRREKTMYIREDDEIAKAIAMSLEDVFEVQLATALKESAALAIAMSVASLPEVQPGDFIQGPATSAGLDIPLVSEPSTSTLGSNNGDGLTGNVLAREPTLADLSANPDPPPPEEKAASIRPEIIGTKDFIMDDWVLDAYLHNALDWWRGKRPARGVSARQTGRCFSCEYRDGCEWREQKASEILAEAKLRRRGLKGATS